MGKRPDADNGDPTKMLRVSQVIDVDDVAFEQLRSLREQVGYTAIDITNDSQPGDPQSADPQDEINLARCSNEKAFTWGNSQ